jgi:hypothetical protein
MTVQTEQTQLDRIEAMLTDLMAIKAIALKLALPRVPERMREQVLSLMAARQGQDWDG